MNAHTPPIAAADGFIANIYSRKFTGQQSSLLLFIYELSLMRGRKVAVIPQLQDFELAGAQRNKVGTGPLQELEEAGVIVRHRPTNGYEIVTDYDKWKVPLVPKFSRQRFDELLIQNPFESDVPKKDMVSQNGTRKHRFSCQIDISHFRTWCTERGHDVPKWDMMYQNRIRYKDLLDIPPIDHIPNGYTMSQNGIWCSIPKRYTISQIGTSYPEIGHEDVPKWDMISRSGTRYTQMGHFQTLASLLSSDSLDKTKRKETETKIHDHDDSVKSLRETYQQYKSVWQAYEQIFGLACNQKLNDSLCSYIDDEMEQEVIIHYLTVARELNKPLQYAKKCIQNAFEAGIRTLEAVVEADKQRLGGRSGTTPPPSGQADLWKQKLGGA